MDNIIVPTLLFFITTLLGVISYFLKKHLENFEDLQDKVANHEVRITVLEKR